MSSVWTLMFESSDEVADISVAHLATIAISKMGQNFPFKRVIPVAIAISAQHFQGTEDNWVIIAMIENVSENKENGGGQDSADLTCKSLTSQTVE